MRYCALISLLLLSAACMAASGVETIRPEVAADAYVDEGYTLVWSDEFNTDGRPDPNNWIYEHGFVRNEELQWYQPQNAFCENGWLVIEGKRETIPNPQYKPESRRWQRSRKQADYTSACVKTVGLREWTYGRFEIRARIDTQPGLWPAIWTLGSARDWPGCGEIDIMEYYDNSILANACWAADSSEGRRRQQSEWDSFKKPISEFNDSDWGLKVHIWRMDWDKDKIELSVDGQLLNTIEIEKTINSRTGITPFREPHYLLLNLAIGGNYGGDPSIIKFPTQYKIDYVRVYQKQP